ncbi:MAG: peroxiredoxin [Glaciihabitans sp.]|jgi:peroxiredoxin|nr:peroxiredoxin [Glaciihabitans sp.]MDQ1571974.1 mycoredoxin-dependent peroxiredoxin [Actinomycetota bacterium]
MPADINSKAPDFDLANQFGERIRLSDFAGRTAVCLVFFPLAFSQTCTAELNVLRDNFELFTHNGVQVVGISVDSKASLRAFAEKEGYDFPLLADFWPHGRVAKTYGAFLADRGYANRTTFVIDSAGVVRASFATAPGEPRAIEDYRTALDSLRTRVT